MGKHPLSYLGVNATTPSQFVIEERDPTNNDFAEYQLGTLWFCTTIPKLWMLSSKDPSVNPKWVGVYPGDGSGTNFFETNSGTASENAGTINIKGRAGGVLTSMAILDEVTLRLDDDLVITNSLKIGTFTDGILRSSSTGQISSLPDGTDGQVLIASSTGVPVWANLTQGSNVTITNGANSIRIASSGGGGGGFAGLVTDSGTAVPDGSDEITLSGSTNITTSAPIAPGTQAIIELKDDITLTGLGSITWAGGGSPVTLKVVNGSLYWGDQQSPTIGSFYNVAIGGMSQGNNASSDENISIGRDSLGRIISGDGLNLAIGVWAGRTGTSFERNIFIGNYAGKLSTGNNNIIIGTELEGSTPSVNNEIKIGNPAVQDSTYIAGIYGATGLGAVNGVVLVNDDSKLVSSIGTLGQVLTSTATGVEWAAGGGGGGSTYAFSAGQAADYTVTGYGINYYLGSGSVLTTNYGTSAFYPGDGAGSPATFTAPVTGKYVFNLNLFLRFGAPSGGEEFYLYIENTSKTYAYFHSLYATSLTERGNFIFTELVNMNAGEVVKFKFRGLTNDPEILSAGTSISGYMLGTNGSSPAPTTWESYAFKFAGSKALTDDQHYFIGTSSAVSPLFSEATSFYGGNGTGTPASFTAKATGTYLFFLENDVASYYQKSLKLFRDGVYEAGIDYFRPSYTTSYTTKTLFVRLVAGEVITFEIWQSGTASGYVDYTVWGYLL